MSGEKVENISQEPVNVLFNPVNITKKDVWDINIIQILEILKKIMNEAGKKDLRIAGIAALSSAVIHKMKVKTIFALQQAAMETQPLRQRKDVNIELINMPYRHESTYPVTLDELLGLLENLIETIANPRTSRRRIQFEPVEVPNFKEYFVSLESLIGKYEDLIVNKIHDAGSGLFSAIVSDLDPIDKIRTFFAILFLAKDEKVELEQTEDDIIITLVK